MSGDYRPGSVVRIWLGFYFHKGIVTETWPRVMVTHASKSRGRVVEETLEDFSGGRHIITEFVPAHGDHAIVARARGYLGRRYVLGEFNCDHLVTAALGQKPNSPQLVGWTLFALLGMVVAVAVR